MWLYNAKTNVTVLVVHEDTIKRCLSEGWVEAASAPHSPAAPDTATPAVASADPGEASPLPTAVATATATEAAHLDAVLDRNDAARRAFGVKPANDKVRRAASGRWVKGGGASHAGS